ncbi:MAG: hypothetical protein OXT71_14965, partial [Acidobacteriota bacterium]|nr:hypothetical protein [Acidobacteriota bacterium]
SVSPLRRLAGGCAPSDPRDKPRSGGVRGWGIQGSPKSAGRRMFSRRPPINAIGFAAESAE